MSDGRGKLFRLLVRRRLAAKLAHARHWPKAKATAFVEEHVDDEVIEAAGDQVGAPTGDGIDWNKVIELILKIVEILLPLLLAL